LIALDTSALMAVLLGEPEAEACIAAMEREEALLMSAGTLAEALVVGDRRNLLPEIQRLIEGLGVTIIPVTAASALRVAQAYASWGKGVHPAGLNFGDCFAYEVARENDCPLLFVGNDFSQTDVQSVL
jgi:ribonuclease VapC